MHPHPMQPMNDDRTHRRGEADALEVEPLEAAVLVVAAHHLPERHLVMMMIWAMNREKSDRGPSVRPTIPPPFPL